MTNRILGLKQWLPLQQAAQYIALVADDSGIGEADLLQLALEHKLTLSAIFPDGVHARRCEAIDEATLQHESVPSLDGKRMIQLTKPHVYFYAPDGHAFKVNDAVERLDDDVVYDLPLIRGELGDIRMRFWELSGSQTEETTSLDGVLVHGGWGRRDYWQLAGRIEASDKRNCLWYPLGNLPENTVLVVKQVEIRRFIDGLTVSQSVPESAAQGPQPMGCCDWPWGTHHTALLGHLDAAARRFWVNFDPSDKTTASTNEEIASWLIERGVSRRMADSMASILRADGLPTGPRTSS